MSLVDLPIPNWYAGKSIFISGGTGFMGKVLIEKLLRSCPDVGKIYLLIRPKKGIDPDDRLKKLFDCDLFSYVRDRNNNVLHKVVPISGDISAPNLGLNEKDEETLIENVDLVFHNAATLKFDEPLKQAIDLNIFGTKRMLDLAQRMKKVMAFVHVSTSYANCHMKNLEEKVYPTATSVASIAKIATIEENVLNAMTPILLEGRPNTYTYTKALAEQMIMESTYSFPIAIVRPSIVTPSYREPFSGWVDSMNGPTGLLLTIGKGILRSVVCDRRMRADFIPVDVVINLMVCVAWKTSLNTDQPLTVYNQCTGVLNPVTWGDLEDMGYKYLLKYPSSGMLWYPGGSFKKSKTHNAICSFFYHTVPAHVIDFFGFVNGTKLKMVALHKKIRKALNCLEYFAQTEWNFYSTNTVTLFDEMKQEDRVNFDFNVKHIDWDKYFKGYILGARKYILKEQPYTLPKARQELFRKYLLDKAVKLTLLFGLWKLLISRIEFAKMAKALSLKLIMLMLPLFRYSTF